MVHVYTVTIPLIYNRFDIIDPEHTTELRLGLNEEITAEFDTVFRSYDSRSSWRYAKNDKDKKQGDS